MERDGNSEYISGSPFLRQSAALGSGGDNARAALRTQHDRVAATVRVGGAAELIDAACQLEQILAIARETLGIRDPDTLVVEGTLAIAYLLGGVETRGLGLAQHTLAAREQVLGPDHPVTLAAADAVAAALRVIGRPKAAARRHEEVIIRRKRVLGGGHPDTIASQVALGLARADAGDLRGAASQLSTTAATAGRVLGYAHPISTYARELLADVSRQVVAAGVRDEDECPASF